jgi:hypothetical protein
MPPEHVMLIAKAFVKVIGYRPFVRYETFQNNEYFTMIEWAHDPHVKIVDIMALPGVRNITKVADLFVEARP